jgi:hypothetical protein
LRFALVILEAELICQRIGGSTIGYILDFRDMIHIVGDHAHAVDEFLFAHCHDLYVFGADLEGDRDVEFVL